jgi:tetratricopeptide (TPR) repeat protein
MDDRFRFLTSGARTAEPRQQTLRSVVDWSYDLLFADEQRVLRRLSVLAGGFDVRAAEVVCAGDDVAVDDIVDIIGHLVDKSLVTVTSREDGTRYRLLQTLVDYGAARLAEAGEDDATRDRHLHWMLQFAADAERGLRGPDQPRWIRRLGWELDNARAALEWARHRRRTGDAVALAAGLAYGWYMTGAVQDGRAFIVDALALEGESSAEDRAVAGAWVAWLIQIGSGATADALDYAERAVVTARGRSTRGLCIAAVVASLLRAYRGHTVEAAGLIEEAAGVLAETPDRWLQAFVDWVRSGLALKIGDAARAEALLRDSVTGFRDEGDRYGQAIASIRLGELAELRGDYDDAIALTTFAYEGTMNTGPGANASILATRLGNLAALQDRFDDAATWHATALSRARELGFPGPAAQALSGMGVAAAMSGLVDDADALHRAALAAYEAVGSVEGAAFSCACLGFLATSRGDAEAATELHRRSLAKAVPGHERRAMALAVDGLAGVYALVGDGPNTARLLGAATELRGPGIVLAPWLGSERARVEASARSVLGDAAYEVAHASGREEADTVVARLVADADAGRVPG